MTRAGEREIGAVSGTVGMHVCYHGLANNLLIIMECRITKRITSLTALSLD